MRDERCEHHNFERRESVWSDSTIPMSIPVTKIALISPESCPECLEERLAILRSALYAVSTSILGERLSTPRDLIERRKMAENALRILFDDVRKWYHPRFRYLEEFGKVVEKL